MDYPPRISVEESKSLRYRMHEIALDVSNDPNVVYFSDDWKMARKAETFLTRKFSAYLAKPKNAHSLGPEYFEARNIIADGNLCLVPQVFMGQVGNVTEEMVEVGFESILNCIDDWNPNRHALSTVVHHGVWWDWIRHVGHDHNQGRPCRVPMDVNDALQHFFDGCEELGYERGEITHGVAEGVIATLDLSDRAATAAMDFANARTLSLDFGFSKYVYSDWVPADSLGDLYERLPDPEAEEVDDGWDAEILEYIIDGGEGFSGVLNRQEREIIQRKVYGGETLRAIARRFHITKERIRQIEIQALAKLIPVARRELLGEV